MCRSGRFTETYMDEMIRKLYAQMPMEKEYDDPIEQKVREELRRLETEKSAAAHPGDLSEIDRLYAAAEVGEEAGFVRGFRYGFRLCMECMQD